jgi:hypothetical protein
LAVWQAGSGALWQGLTAGYFVGVRQGSRVRLISAPALDLIAHMAARCVQGNTVMVLRACNRFALDPRQ